MERHPLQDGGAGTYASRLRRLLLPKKTSVASGGGGSGRDARQEFLLGNDDDSAAAPSFNNQRYLSRRHSSAGTEFANIVEIIPDLIVEKKYCGPLCGNLAVTATLWDTIP